MNARSRADAIVDFRAAAALDAELVVELAAPPPENYRVLVDALTEFSLDCSDEALWGDTP